MRVPALWALVLGCTLGIFLRSVTVFGWWTILFIVMSALTLVLSTYLARDDAQRALLAALFLFALACGAARMERAVLSGEPVLDAWLGEKITLEGIVVAEPDRRENTMRLTVQVSEAASTTIESGMRVLVVAPLHSAIAYGDRIHAEGELGVPEAFEAGAGRLFAYPGFLAKDGIGYELSFARVRDIGDGPRNPLTVIAITLKQKYVEGLSLALPEPEAGLAGGITAGDKRGLGSELSDTFRIVGLIHIVVLSGYNIMVVIQFLERMLGGARIWVRSISAIMIALFFALITGLASSSVRAASMAVIATIGKTTGRTYLATRALGVVAVGMLLWNPWLLVFDPGFQLSILATVGLIHIAPIVAARLTWITEQFGLREIASATVGTQLAVLPLILYQSGSFSLYALPANLLSLVVVPYAMLLSFLAGSVGLIAGPLAPLLGFPAFIALWYIVSVAEFFAGLPFAALEIPRFSVLWLCVSYAVLGFILFLHQKKTAERDAPPFVNVP